MEFEPKIKPSAEADPAQQDETNKNHSTPAQSDPQKVNAGRTKICHRDQIYDKDGRCIRLVKSAQKHSVSKKLSNVVILARRIHTERMQYSHTEYDVRDRTLRDLLSEIHKDSKGFELTDGDVEVDINILYWAAPRLSQRIQELSLAGLQSPEDQKEQFAIEAALQLVQDECSPKIASLAETLPRNKIRWETLWMILPPNVYVYTKDEFGQDRVFLLRRHRQRRKEDNSVVLEMETEHVDSDGSKLGVVQNVIELPQFEGVSAIADLPVYPLEYHPRVNEVTKELLDRGKKQLKYHRPGPGQRHTVTEHKRYGFKPGLKNLEKFNTHGRLVIDAAAMEEVCPQLGLLPKLTGFRTRHGRAPRSNCSSKDTSDNGTKLTCDDDSGYSAYSTGDLPDSLTILLSGRVYGYSLGDCVWGIFAVDNLDEVRWNDTLFDSLVMSEKQKNLISQLIKSHGSHGSGFDDFVKDKGRGLVGLLLGSPGLGKTFTAEAIAETAEMPLFMMSSGSLGQTATDINQNLKIFLELATRWKSVLLLDEAEVFLAKRSTSDLERNSIVSVFLRELEYYPGILILTTNRAHTIDEAFQSRIHFVYRYPSHDLAARRRIWNNFITMARKNEKITVDIDDEGIETLAEMPFNGRQIKNAMSIAVELAAFNVDCNRMAAQNIIDASVCLQNFESMSDTNQTVVPAALSEHPRKEQIPSELRVDREQDRSIATDMEPRSQAPVNSTPAASSKLAPPIIYPIVSTPLEGTREPSSSGKKKPRKLNQKSQSTEKGP